MSLSTRPLFVLLIGFACEAGADPSEVASVHTGDDAHDTPVAPSSTIDPAPVSAPTPSADADAPLPEFGCILDWPQVRAFRITNTLGNVDDSLAIARANQGGVYPVGTLIQLIPQEAMVKRRPGWGPQSGDWEFFSLEVKKDSTKVLARGTSGVINQFGGDCLECHAMASPKWDFICESGHGCEDLPLSDRLIQVAQNSNPRCAAKP